jgi:hypothetical protein
MLEFLHEKTFHCGPLKQKVILNFCPGLKLKTIISYLIAIWIMNFWNIVKIHILHIGLNDIFLSFALLYDKKDIRVQPENWR